MPRRSDNDPDSCYICGKLTFNKQRGNFTKLVMECYHQYFDFTVDYQEKPWAHPICYITCVKNLSDWKKGFRDMPFAVPLIRTEPKYHASDRYFCLTDITGIH